MQETKAYCNKIFMFSGFDFYSITEIVLSNGIRRPRETLKVILSIYQIPKTEHVSFLKVFFSLVVWQIILTKFFRSFCEQLPQR